MAKQTVNIGDTGSQLVSKLANNFSEPAGDYFNVENYGAVHDGNTDDTASIQAAIDACNTAGGGIIYFPNGIYVIGGALVASSGGVAYNSQLIIPFVDNNNETRKTFYFLGETPPNMAQSSGIVSGGVNHIAPSTGVILKSTIAGSGTRPSVISGGDTTDSYIWAIGNANQVVFENIQIQPVLNANSKVTIGALNLSLCIDVNIKNVSCFPFNANLVNTAAPLNSCVGIIMPYPGCGNHNTLQNVSVGGFDTGFICTEHTTIKDTVAMCCNTGYKFTNAGHAIQATRMGAYWCGTGIKFEGSYCVVKIDSFIEEQVLDAYWYNYVSTITDTGNIARGLIFYNSSRSGGSIAQLYANTYYSKSGGANLQCYPIAKADATVFTVSGVRNNPEAALANLLTALAAQGIIIDSTTES